MAVVGHSPFFQTWGFFFSDVGLFRGRRPVLCGALSEAVRVIGSSRGRLRIVSSLAFTVIMLGRRPGAIAA